jgi:hypothetical protein
MILATALTAPRTPYNPLQHNFYLSSGQQSDCDKYYLLYWETKYFLNLLDNSPIKNHIRRQDIWYEVFLQDGLELSDLELFPQETIKLSFRRKTGSTSGYVLVNKIYTPCFNQTTTGS